MQARQMLDGYRADSRQLARPAVVQGPGYWELLEEMRLSRRQTLAELRKKRETHYDGGVRRERDGVGEIVHVHPWVWSAGAAVCSTAPSLCPGEM